MAFKMKGMNFGKGTGSALKKDPSKTRIGDKITSAGFAVLDTYLKTLPHNLAKGNFPTPRKDYKKYKQEHRNKRSQQVDGMYMTKGSGVSR